MKGNIMKERFQKVVDGILNDFDFVKVHETMVKLDWQWYHSGEEVTRVPSLDIVKVKGKELLQEAADKAAGLKSEWIISSGGFRAEAKYYKKDEDYRKKSELWVRLAFVLEEWDNCE